MASVSEAGAPGASYLQILKSTALIGGSSAINIFFAILRTKAAAVLLGPGGFGLMGLYNSVLDLTQTVANLGVQSSGVRQIAEAAAQGDKARVARTALVLRRISLLLGICGALLLFFLAVPVARLTFGDAQHAAGVALVSAAVFFRLVSSGQTALLQGLRRIADLARINVIGAFCATAITIPLLYLFGQDGIVPSLVAGAAVGLLVSWSYSRKVRIGPAAMDMPQMRQEASDLLKLGVAFMTSAVVVSASAYLVRLIVVHADGLVAAGLYQAAWTLGGLYAGFILQAMGADFYPRLTAACHDNGECNRLVNEQAQIGMLLAGPGLLATLTLTPLVISLLYSPQFRDAVDVLRWICLGMMLRVVCWPVGFIIIAKGARAILAVTEIAAGIVHVGMAWLLTARFGVVGAGAAFFCLYIWHGALVYLIARRMSGFRWSRANLGLGAVFLPLAAGVFAGFLFLPALPASLIGIFATAATGIYCLVALVRLMPPEALPAFLRARMSRAG